MITDVVSEVAVRLRLPEKWKIHNCFQVSRLKEVRQDQGEFPSRNRSPPPEPIVTQAQDEYEVETVLDMRKLRRGRRLKTEYLVRWAGYGPEDDTWEPSEGLKEAKEAVKLYHEKLSAV